MEREREMTRRIPPRNVTLVIQPCWKIQPGTTPRADQRRTLTTVSRRRGKLGARIPALTRKATARNVNGQRKIGGRESAWAMAYAKERAMTRRPDLSHGRMAAKRWRSERRDGDELAGVIGKGGVYEAKLKEFIGRWMMGWRESDWL